MHRPEPGVRPDVLDAIQASMHAGGDGEREGARHRLMALWASLASDDHFHRCIVAHYLADLQTDPALELAWDRRALDAAGAAPPHAFDDRIPDVDHASLLPSLHLNLAASYARLGDRDAARRHAVLAREGQGALPATPLGEMTRAAIQRLCAALGVATGTADDAQASADHA